jgi:2-polyprenyl-6-methoxyphenol hydroxylase-like FAD-dependent oxidoreductase
LGLSVRIIDRKLTRSVHDSRAVVVHPRVMELLEPIRNGDLTSEIQKTAFQLKGMFAYMPKWFEWLPGCGRDSTVNSTSDSKGENSKGRNDDPPVHLDLSNVKWGDTKYPNLYFLPQYDTERILEEGLASEGGTVDYGIALEDLAQENGVVTTTLRNVDTDTTEKVTSRWVLGADGGRSKTRDLLGHHMDRHKSGIYFVIADVVFKGDNIPLASHAPGKGGHVFLPSVPMAFLPLPGENAYRLAGQAPPGITSKDDVTLDEKFFRDFLLERTGKKFELELGPWQTIFEITHGTTNSYRKDNVMLAGDASHVHSPIGGQGMNLGMQDVSNLLWKLAWSKRILRASSSEEDYAEANQVVDAILGTYDSERHSLGQEMIQSIGFATKMLAMKNPLVNFFRNELIRFVMPSNTAKQNFRKMGQLDLAYAPSSSSLLFQNKSLTAYYVCSPGQRMPNIRLEDGSHLHSHIDRVKHTWVILNNNHNDSDKVEAPLAFSSKAKIVRASVSGFENQVSVPVISKKAYAAPQVLLVRPDQFVAGVGASTEALLDELKRAGMTEMALATM